MSDDTIETSKAAQFVQYLYRATKDCSDRCGSIKLDQDFGEEERDCLKKCAVQHYGFTNAHVKFVRQFSENQALY